MSSRTRRRRLRQLIGPGFIAAASDNDPTTVASLAVIGSTTRYALLWLVVLVVPLLVVVQAVSARVGAVTGRGLEDVVRDRYGSVAALATLLLVLAVNVMTIGADLSGGAAALGLMAGGDARWLIAALALAIVALLWLGSYGRVQRLLRVPMLVYAAFIVSAFMASPDWGQVLRRGIVPSFSSSSPYVDGALALLGTTLTSYAYFWESISAARGRAPLRRLGMAQLDAGLGMIAAGVVFFFIVVGTGATLGAHHQTVRTAADAARALAPLAGHSASLLFGIGLLASALLALPVLAGTSAYVLAEAVGWKGDLDDGFGSAPRFYVAILIVVVGGVVIAVSGIGAITLLFDSSLAGGVATPFTLALMMRAASDPRVMREHRLHGGLRLAGWAVVGVVSLACLLFLVRGIAG